MEIKYNTKISLIVTFIDQSFPQTHFNYYRILVDKDGKIPSKKLSLLNKTIEEDLRELYNTYLKVDFEWPVKFLANCRKIGNIIEVTYSCQLPFIRDCYKNCSISTVNQYLSKETDTYYAEIISTGSNRSFR
jgi:hypothetical protein